MPRRMSPRAQRIAWWVVGILFVVLMTVLCLNNIRQMSEEPVTTHLAYYGIASLEPVSGGTAHATRSSYLVGVDLTRVSSQLRWLLVGQIVNHFVIETAAGLVLGVIWIRTSAGRPFARSVARSLTALAIIVAVLGSFQEALDSWVDLRAAFEAVGNSEFGHYQDVRGFQIDGGHPSRVLRW